MSLLDTASLVVTPNGTKASKLYSVVPSSGAGDLDVTRATTATRVNSSGLIESVASNVPRLDYTNGECPSILVEPQRTNLLWYSEQLDNAGYWTTFNASVTGNTAVSPDGNTTADTITSNASSGGDVYRSIVTNGIHTFSAYFKAGTTNLCKLGSTVGGEAVFNLNTQTYTLSGGISASIKSVGNGWFYCTLTVNVIVSTLVYLSSFDTTGKTVFAWGAQLEAGSYATSYIPTTSASVTRNADVISKAGISSLIGQTEGTLFLDWKFIDYDINGIIAISLDNDSANGTYFYIDGGGKIYSDFIVGGTIQSSISTALGFATKNTRYKMAIAYKNNDFVFYINGNLIGTDTSGSVVQFSKLALNYPYSAGYLGNKNVNLTALWKTRLTNTQLAQLTTI
jgi:hypothetical protein